MADEADLAFDSEQRHLTHALAAQRQRVGALQPVGSCHNCGNSDGLEQRLFCDSDCAADWEYEDALRRRLGLPGAQGYARATSAAGSAAA
ncbi:hypothetical protein [Ramlibacter sp. AN1133]|uniref:hypothetical protein n=1 Tax=Ramlibacter sp. AN1133 TaxID=3133429 RepID=UPI0030C51314